MHLQLWPSAAGQLDKVQYLQMPLTWPSSFRRSWARDSTERGVQTHRRRSSQTRKFNKCPRLCADSTNVSHQFKTSYSSVTLTEFHLRVLAQMFSITCFKSNSFLVEQYSKWFHLTSLNLWNQNRLRFEIPDSIDIRPDIFNSISDEIKTQSMNIPWLISHIM